MRYSEYGEYRPLPSSTSALQVARGESGAWLTAAGHTLGRAAIIATGAYVAGLRGRDVLKASLGGAAAIEVFALLYFGAQVKEIEG